MGIRNKTELGCYVVAVVHGGGVVCNANTFNFNFPVYLCTFLSLYRISKGVDKNLKGYLNVNTLLHYSIKSKHFAYFTQPLPCAFQRMKNMQINRENFTSRILDDSIDQNVMDFSRKSES